MVVVGCGWEGRAERVQFLLIVIKLFKGGIWLGENSLTACTVRIWIIKVPACRFIKKINLNRLHSAVTLVVIDRNLLPVWWSSYDDLVRLRLDYRFKISAQLASKTLQEAWMPLKWSCSLFVSASGLWLLILLRLILFLRGPVGISLMLRPHFLVSFLGHANHVWVGSRALCRWCTVIFLCWLITEVNILVHVQHKRLICITPIGSDLALTRQLTFVFLFNRLIICVEHRSDTRSVLWRHKRTSASSGVGAMTIGWFEGSNLTVIALIVQTTGQVAAWSTNEVVLTLVAESLRVLTLWSLLGQVAAAALVIGLRFVRRWCIHCFMTCRVAVAWSGGSRVDTYSKLTQSHVIAEKALNSGNGCGGVRRLETRHSDLRGGLLGGRTRAILGC